MVDSLVGMTDNYAQVSPEVWAFFGFGMSPFLLRGLVSSEDPRLAGVSWAVILPTSHHSGLVRGLGKVQDLLVVESEGKAAPPPPLFKTGFSDSKTSWSVFRDLDAQKFVGRPRKRDDRERELVAHTLVVRKFLEKTNPSLLLFPQPIETPLGMLVHREATRLSIKVAVPYHLRLWDRSFFSNSPREVPSTMSRRDNFALSAVSAGILSGETNLTAKEAGMNKTILGEWDRRRRFVGFLKRFFSQSDTRRPSSLRISLFSGWAPWLWRSIQRVRRLINGRLYNASPDDFANQKFIFFPLQYTPESSINVPEPFFIDQMRVIDAIRYSMPSDHVLVVKEHPAAIGVRKARFIRKVTELPGVRVVRWDSSTPDLIRRASLTVTVTGTAALEAFLLGKPSVVFAPTFFSELMGGPADVGSLRQQLIHKMTVAYSESEIERGVSELLERSRSFVAVAPETMRGETVSHLNIGKMIDALFEWLQSYDDGSEV